MKNRKLRRQLGYIQRRLQSYYQLEDAPHVADFVRTGEASARETVLVREADGSLELAVFLPEGASRLRLESATPNDLLLQVVEGVSHFVYLAERARTELPTTQLELELQAEVDKFVVLAANGHVDSPRARALHTTLYEAPRYLHGAHTEAGQRYRLATRLAARLIAGPLRRKRDTERHRLLRQFYRAGQSEKIRLAHSA